MKRIQYISLILSFFLISCVQEVDILNNKTESEQNEATLNLSFAISTGKIKTAQVRSTEKSIEEIHSLKILVFNEEHNFLYSRNAILGANSEVPSDDNKNSLGVKKISVDLLSSEKERTLHFIANYDWDGFPQDYFLEGKSEGDIIANMKSESPVYWNTIPLKNIDTNTLKDKTIKLVRNYAEVSIHSTTTRNFELAGFTIYNNYTEGSVAPFEYNEVTQDFHFPYPSLKPTIPINSKTAVPRDFSLEPTQLFEYDNALEKTVFALVKGRYNNSNLDSYYKIDFRHTEKETGITTLHNILRNTRYIITIGAVTSAGYSSAEEAASKPASNNLFASIELAEYPSVSDGNTVLTIDKLGGFFTGPDWFETKVFFTHGVDQLNIYPSWSGANDFIDSLELIPNPEHKEFGILRAKIKKIPQEGVEELSVNIVGESELNTISRKLVFRLREPYLFNAKLQSMGLYNGSRVDIEINMPANMHKSVLPFDIDIASTSLTPYLPADPTQDETINHHMLIKLVDGKYYYSYQVKEEDLGNKITLKFVRNEYGKSERILLRSKYFTEKFVDLPSTEY